MELVLMPLQKLKDDENNIKNTTFGFNVRRLEEKFAPPIGAYSMETLEDLARQSLSFRHVLSSLRSTGCVAKKWLLVAADFMDSDGILRSVVAAGRCRALVTYATFHEQKLTK